MKLVLTVLGVILLVIAAMYALVPADQLPGFFPGHEDGVTRVQAVNQVGHLTARTCYGEGQKEVSPF